MKVKINNIDEFCEALKTGNKIHTKNFVMKVENKGIEMFNKSTGCYSRFFFTDMIEEKPDSLKIEKGECYQTREGKKAFVSCFYTTGKDYDFKGMIEDEDFTIVWTKEGFYLTDGHAHKYDLVAEWKED